MKISDPGALTFQEEETLNTSNSIPFPAGQNTSEPISSSEYIELSTIKQTETDFDRQRNTTTPPNIFNISNRFELANYSNLIDSYGEAGSRPKILYNTAEARAIEEEEGGVKIIDLNQYPYNKPDNILPKKNTTKSWRRADKEAQQRRNARGQPIRKPRSKSLESNTDIYTRKLEYTSGNKA